MLALVPRGERRGGDACGEGIVDLLHAGKARECVGGDVECPGHMDGQDIKGVAAL